MPKLLIVTDAWTPQVNGVVTHITNVSAGLKKLGVDVVVVHPGMFSRVLPLVFYPEIKMAYFPGMRMRAIFKREKPDYVHISTEGSLGQSARWLCMQKKILFTTFYHTNFPQYLEHYLHGGKALNGIAEKLIWAFHRKAKAVFVSTASMKQELEEQGHTNVVISPSGADISFFVRNENRIPEEAKNLLMPLFVYFGRVAKEKNIEEFLEASLPGTKLVIGDGPQLKELSKKYADSATFVGYKQGQDLVDWLSACDVSVFPSRTDTFGLVIVEALAVGIPVAAHDVVGPKDIITPGVDGYLDEDLGKAALACLSLSRDACRKKALQYSWDSVSTQFWQNIQTYS